MFAKVLFFVLGSFLTSYGFFRQFKKVIRSKFSSSVKSFQLEELPLGFEIDPTLVNRPPKQKQPISVTSIEQLKSLIYQGYRVEDLDVRGDTTASLNDSVVHPVVQRIHQRAAIIKKLKADLLLLHDEGFEIFEHRYLVNDDVISYHEAQIETTPAATPPHDLVYIKMQS